ncbi:lachrymatory-factor synthase-like [Gastrolobium bilobum]|uniref:lachrymatory-factor synthase-like n=1 Tax=Gastrolobium bilobum TaxID=150636 RepID=UPI002AB23E75|nr:lachrymatory-factor synthase-like [Gastrolobium bilobum]
MEQDSHQRWEGKVSAKLRSTTSEQAWQLVKDFFNIHKRFPTLATCYGIHGSNGEPGCIRYCAGSSIRSNGSESVSWSKERLVAVDDVDRSLKYEIVESNIGFKSYEATMRVLNDDDGSDGCMLEWSFVVDPVEGWVLEDLVRKYQTTQLLLHFHWLVSWSGVCNGCTIDISQPFMPYVPISYNARLFFKLL